MSPVDGIFRCQNESDGLYLRLANIELGFDGNGRLNETTVKTSGGSSLDYQKLSYDSEDRMSYRRRGTSSSSYVQTDYGYDKADQLLQEENSASGASYFKGVYVYDQNGNRTSKALTVGTGSAVTTNFTYDAGDKMIAYGSYTIPYDAAGRPTQWPVNRPSTGYGLAYMNWDYEGRLTQIKASSGGTSVPFFTSTYNGLNTRVAANAAPAGTLGYRRFSRSGGDVTAPVRSMRWGNLLSPSYTRSTPGVSKRTGSTTTYAHNGIKNEDAQSQTSTAVSATKDYDAWGGVIGSSGTWQGISGYGGPYGYQEDETGIRLLGNRFYDPGAGRFLARDPIQDGRNWYSYCNNNPLIDADPSGLQVRSLTSEERKGVYNGIIELFKNRRTDDAINLETLLNGSNIKAEGGLKPYAQTSPGGVIYLRPDIIPTPDKYAGSVRKLRGKMQLTDEILLGGFLLHEFQHVQRPPNWFNKSSRELEAWTVQIAWLEGQLLRKDLTPYIKGRLKIALDEYKDTRNSYK